VLKKIFGSERDEVSGDRGRSHNDGLYEFCWSDEFKKNGMGEASGTYGGEKRCIQGLGGKFRGKQATWKTCT
jgi:hypothetical protein